MSAPLVHYLALTLVFAAWAMTHLVLVVRTVRHHRPSWAARMASALLPPATPLIAWRRAGQWAGALLWASLAVAYAAVWWSSQQ